jgi:CHAT domain-containing protein
MNEKLKILFLLSNPKDISPLQLAKEMREIEEKIRVGKFRDAFELKSQWAVRPSDLQEALLLFEPHIVHFSGHGASNEQIILENDAGNSKPVGKEALTNLFKILKDNLRLVVLNACFSQTQAEAINGSIDFTVGTSKAVKDGAAISFASSFYRSLAFGRSVREAFELANNQLDLLSIEGSDITRLFVRAGANDQDPFLVPGGATKHKRRIYNNRTSKAHQS